MALKGDIFIGPNVGDMTLVSAFGRKLTIENMEISRSQRMASGRLVRDIVSVKKRFKLNYENIDGADLEVLLDFYDLQDELILWIQHTDDSTTTTEEAETNYDQYTVLMEPISYTRELLLGDGLYSGVLIEMQEV